MEPSDDVRWLDHVPADRWDELPTTVQLDGSWFHVKPNKIKRFLVDPKQTLAPMSETGV